MAGVIACSRDGSDSGVLTALVFAVLDSGVFDRTGVGAVTTRECDREEDSWSNGGLGRDEDSRGVAGRIPGRFSVSLGTDDVDPASFRSKVCTFRLRLSSLVFSFRLS